MTETKLKLIVGGLKGQPAKQYEPKVRAVNLVMFRSLDPDAPPEKWEPVKPADVPEFLKSEDMISKLVEGNMAQTGAADPHWYRAEQLVALH